MDDLINIGKLSQGNALLALANWYAFTPGELLENLQVQSRMLLWCVQGRGQVWVNGEKHLIETDHYLLLPWSHRVKYQADAYEPFRVGGIHLIPHQERVETPVYAVSHSGDDHLAGLTTRRDAHWFGLKGLVSGSMRDTPRLRWLCGYLIEWTSSGHPPEVWRRTFSVTQGCSG